VDNFIHSVVKIEDELKQNWTDARLTLACKEGFTLVYDEFNRSRPEVNNVLLSALEEKLLILPPGEGQSEYIRVNPNFRAIFTSNPEEYCGVHGTQDALLDRLVTISMPEPDEQTQQAILLQKTKIDPESALRIVQIVKSFRDTVKQSIPASDRYAESAKHSSPLRSCLMIAKVSQEHNLRVQENNQDFREVCADVLLSRTNLEWDKAQEILNRFLDARVPLVSLVKQPLKEPLKEPVKEQKMPGENGLNQQEFVGGDSRSDGSTIPPGAEVNQSESLSAEPLVVEEPNYDENGHKLDGRESQAGLKNGQALLNGKSSSLNLAKSFTQMRSPQEKDPDGEAEVYRYLAKSEGMRVSQISKALGLNRFETIDALRSLMKKGLLIQRDDRLYVASQDNASQDKLS
jgi:gas vesicle protein GvpN